MFYGLNYEMPWPNKGYPVRYKLFHRIYLFGFIEIFNILNQVSISQ